MIKRSLLRPLAKTVDHLKALPGRQLSRLFSSRGGLPLRTTEVWLTNHSGYRVAACLHEPEDSLLRPGVLLVPGVGESGASFCHLGGLVGADELASLGLRVLHFSPVGRGATWGHDDYCGRQGQDSCRAALECLHATRGVDPSRVAVLSFSLGVALAAPVLAEHGERLGTYALLDWEGTHDRASMEALGPLPPAAEASERDNPEHFWRVRDPEPSLGQLPCPHHHLKAGRTRAISNRFIRAQLRELFQL